GGARRRDRGGRAGPAARIPVPVRRAVHVRHRGRDHPYPFGRWSTGRRRQARPGDAPAAGTVLRIVRRFHARPPSLVGTAGRLSVRGPAQPPAPARSKVKVATTPRTSPGRTRTSQP